MVVLDHEQVRGARDERLQLGGTFGFQRGPERILRPGSRDDGLYTLPQGSGECVRHEPVVVDRDAEFGQAERGQQVAKRRVGRILDQNAVARPQVGGQHPLDPVKRAGHDRESSHRDSVSRERRRRELEQVGVVGVEGGKVRVAVEVDPAQGRGDRGQEGRVREAQAEIAALRRGRCMLATGTRRDPQRRPRRHACAAAARADHEAALAQDAVGRADRRGAALE